MGRQIEVKCQDVEGLDGEFERGVLYTACFTIDEDYFTVLDGTGEECECPVVNFLVMEEFPFGKDLRKREKLDPMCMDLKDMLIKMSEGNPGGLSVIMEIIKQAGPEQGWLFMHILDEMNMRGSQIWLGYKDHCGQDLQAFMEAVRKRSLAMVAKINSMMDAHGTGEVVST
jgi:hypothetical protein